MQSKLKIKIQVALLAVMIFFCGVIIALTFCGLVFPNWFTKDARLPSGLILNLYLFNSIAVLTFCIIYIFELAKMKAKNEMNDIIQREAERKAKKLFDDIAKKAFSDLN